MSPQHIVQSGVMGLIMEAGPVAKLILFLLLVISIICWTIIFSKSKTIGEAIRQNELFLKMFWHGKTIDEIFTKSDQFTFSPVAAVFKYGVKELRKFPQINHETFEPNVVTGERVDNIYRALLRASNMEVTFLEKNMGWLATTASAAPFVGLFGTVWGIMNSFQNIGATGGANLAVVAPGISEALITTATGIAAAIPAVVAYNYFVGKIKRIAVDMECFSQDFLNIIQRSVLLTQPPAAPKRSD